LPSTDLLLRRPNATGHRACHATHERAPHAQTRVSGGLFEKIERAALNDLPAEDWEFAEWQRARSISIITSKRNDFLSFGSAHADSAPRSNVRITARTVEIFHRGQRVAPISGAMAASTVRPRAHAQLAPALRRVDAGSVPPLAAKIGPNTEGLIVAVLATGRIRARLSNLPGDFTLLSRCRSGPG